LPSHVSPQRLRITFCYIWRFISFFILYCIIVLYVWQKATDVHTSRANSCSVLCENLASLNVPTDDLMCHDMNCCEASHCAALGHYYRHYRVQCPATIVMVSL